MKFRFNREEMAEALSAVSSVAAVRTTKDILRCVRLEVQSDVVLLSATDLELSLRYGVTQVEVEQPGAVLAVADVLTRIVRECTDEVLTAESKGNVLHLRESGSHFQLVTQDAREFPAVATMEGDPDITIEHAQLSRLIELTAFATARESTRYAINGVLWEVTDSKLTLAATDGRRLAVASGSLSTEPRADIPQAIVPTKALSVFNRLPIEAEARVGVRFASNQLLLNTGPALVGTALVEGHFPKYQDVVPPDCDRVATINAAEFQSALRRASLLTNEESRGVRFAFQEDSLTLSSRAPEQGEAEISLPVKFKAEPLEIGFNPAFLLDVLRVAHAEELTLALREPTRPGILRLEDDFVYVLMPVNLSSA